jgi:hypothetical protein
MKKLLFLILLLAFGPMAFSQNGKIQIQAEPGILIVFDGEQLGYTKPELNGLVIEDVTPGWHSINAIKPGYRTQKGSIYLEPRDIKFYNIERFVPEITISESGGVNEGNIGETAGNLQIQSIPAEIRVVVPEFEIDFNKSLDRMLLQDMPAGRILVQFVWNNKRFSYQFEILGNRQTNVMVDMMNGSGKIDQILYSDIVDLKRSPDVTSTQPGEAYRRETAYLADQTPQEIIEVQGEQYTQMNPAQNTSTYAPGTRGDIESGEAANISVSGLDARQVIGELPSPKITDCRADRENTVTVEIVVNQEGNVVAASVRDATYEDRCIWNKVKQAALGIKFSADPNASSREKGWVIYKIRAL